jgi:hypothetical protein
LLICMIIDDNCFCIFVWLIDWLIRLFILDMVFCLKVLILLNSVKIMVLLSLDLRHLQFVIWVTRGTIIDLSYICL